MKSIILYSQPNASGEHQQIQATTGERIYIRAEVVSADALHALDAAKPRDGETVLNAVDIP